MKDETDRTPPGERGVLAAASGCLPLYVVVALGVLGTLVWMAPVETPRHELPKKLGIVDFLHDDSADFLVSLRTTLPLPFVGSAADEPLRAELPPMQAPAMEAPPSLGDVSPLPDSAVLPRAEMLRMPPGMQPQPTGKEVQP